MTIKELAHSAQQYLQTNVGGSFKRSHIYELLAASFGFNSYAAFGVDSVFTELRPGDKRPASQDAFVARRYIELGYPSDTADPVIVALQYFLVERQIGVTSISSLISGLRGESPNQEDDLEDDQDELSDPAGADERFEDDDTTAQVWIDGLFDPADEVECSPILLDSLEKAASKGNAQAHYVLALIHAREEENSRDAGNSYWYSQEQQGHLLTGVKKEWAEAHKAYLIQVEKYTYHLREAGRLGNAYALFDLAERFDDPSFFEQSHRDVDADPVIVAAIAERMGRVADARRWLSIAAESGDTDAMLRLIEEYDQGDPIRCWTWVYLSKLVGTDLTQDDYYAINEDGSRYDFDIGGPAFVDGRGGIKLEPLRTEQDATAKLAAQNLFEQMHILRKAR